MPRKSAAKKQSEAYTLGPANCTCALRVSGCHDNGRFAEGDIAYVAQTSDINHGDYVAVKWPEGDPAIFRAFDVDGMRVYVSIWDQTDLAPIFADNLPFEILGRIVGVRFKND